MTWKKGKVEGSIITSPQEAPEAPSIETVKVFGGLPIAQAVHPTVIDFFMTSKDLFACATEALIYLKRYPGATAIKQSENIRLQRQLIKAIGKIPTQYVEIVLLPEDIELLREKEELDKNEIKKENILADSKEA